MKTQVQPIHCTYGCAQCVTLMKALGRGKVILYMIAVMSFPEKVCIAECR